VTAQMEVLLDEVVLGQQEMMGAIDAVCAQASRIIGRLLEGAGPVDPALLATTRRAGGPGPGAGRKAGPAFGAKRRAPARRPASRDDAPPGDEEGVERPARRRAAAAAPARKKRATGEAPADKPARRRRAPEAARPAPGNEAPAEGETPLRIPFGNKEAAIGLGARYRTGGWYAPSGSDLGPFRERGWL